MVKVYCKGHVKIKDLPQEARKFDKRKETGRNGSVFAGKAVKLMVPKLSLSSAGRIAYAIALIVFGILHFKGADSLLELVPGYMPFGHWFWIYFVGIALVLSGLSIIFRKFDRLACIMLAGMFILFILMVRIPALGKLEGKAKDSFLIELSKELALAGSALVIAGGKKKTETGS
jgi:uncharacterized membrane protein